MEVRSGHFSEDVYQAHADFRRALLTFFHVSEDHARQLGIIRQQYLTLLAIPADLSARPTRVTLKRIQAHTAGTLCESGGGALA